MSVTNTMVGTPAKTGGTKEYINFIISLVKAKNPSEVEIPPGRARGHGFARPGARSAPRIPLGAHPRADRRSPSA